jgi:hypothetical protein
MICIARGAGYAELSNAFDFGFLWELQLAFRNSPSIFVREISSAEKRTGNAHKSCLLRLRAQMGQAYCLSN